MKKLFILVIALIMTYGASSQMDPPQVTNKYLIKNATVISQPGIVYYNSSILIDDGIIIQIGNNIVVPYDAEIIDADSLFVYPAFIATLSHIGLITPEESSERPKVKRTGYPPNDIAGITPEQDISKLYKKDDSAIKSFREQGFAIAHTVPNGKMMPGKGSVISLSGDELGKVLIKENMSLFAQFSGANRIFPATTIGVMAKWRELYKNAEMTIAHDKLYSVNPKNKKRSQTDAATEALFPVISKEIPVFFQTEKHLDIARALQLQKDLGFDLTLSEVTQGEMMIEKIKKSNSSVLISLDLPKEDKTKEDKLDDSTKALLAKKKESIKKYNSQAAAFESANSPFAFSFLETKSKDVMKNIGTMIKNGLSQEAALGALTIDAARALKIDNITGSIERGKMANIIITTDTLFKEKAKIKSVFVDGVQHKIEIKEKKKSASGETTANISGKWKYEIEIPGMTPNGTLTINKDGDDISIIVTSNQNPGEEISATNISLDGNTLNYDFSVPSPGMTISVNSEITFDGDTFEGEVSVADFGSFPIEGEKISSPE